MKKNFKDLEEKLKENVVGMEERRTKGIFEWNLKKEENIYILNSHIISLGFRCFHEKVWFSLIL
jgi:hypothetical protein